MTIIRQPQAVIKKQMMDHAITGLFLGAGCCVLVTVQPCIGVCCSACNINACNINLATAVGLPNTWALSCCMNDPCNLAQNCIQPTICLAVGEVAGAAFWAVLGGLNAAPKALTDLFCVPNASDRDGAAAIDARLLDGAAAEDFNPLV